MTFKESMGVNYVKKRLSTASSHFLLTVYRLIKKELKMRGVLKKRPTGAQEKDK